MRRKQNLQHDRFPFLLLSTFVLKFSEDVVMFYVLYMHVYCVHARRYHICSN